MDIVVEHEGRKFHGVGLATDIVESSALALVHAINAIYRAHKVADIKTTNIINQSPSLQKRGKINPTLV